MGKLYLKGAEEESAEKTVVAKGESARQGRVKEQVLTNIL